MPGRPRKHPYLRLALATAAATALLGGTAQAATTTIGSTLNATFAQSPFAANTTVTNFILPSPGVATSPTDGTVISWRFVGAPAGAGGQFTPRIVHPTAGTTSTGSGSGTAVNATPPPAVSGPFTTSLPIKRGDMFGVDVPSGGTLGTAATPGATYLTWTPPLVNGAGGRAPTASIAGEAAVSATVRFCKVPKMKGLGGKAARQALAAADCTLGNIIKFNKRRPTKQVVRQSVKANVSIADTQPIDLTIAPKKKAKKKKKR